MFENENTAQTTDTEVSDAVEDAGGSENTAGEVSDASFKDTDSGESGDDAGKSNDESSDAGTDNGDNKAKQRSTDAENARRRRETERRQESARQRELDAAKNEARNKAILDVLGGVNPYTQEPMKDARDVEEYLTMKEIEKAGKDPVADFSRYQKQRERERDEQTRAAEAQKEWYRNDQAEFAKKHPDVNVSELIQNKTFLSVAAGKVGKVPLSEIYAEYISAKDEIIKEYQQKTAKEHANKKASPGALGGDGGEATRFTLEQMQGMSRAEVRRNWAAIQESLKHI